MSVSVDVIGRNRTIARLMVDVESCLLLGWALMHPFSRMQPGCLEPTRMRSMCLMHGRLGCFSRVFPRKNTRIHGKRKRPANSFYGNSYVVFVNDCAAFCELLRLFL